MSRPRSAVLTLVVVSSLLAAPRARAEGFEIDLHAAYSRSAYARNVALLATLSVPLDRSAAPRLAEPATAPRDRAVVPRGLAPGLVRRVVAAALRHAGLAGDARLDSLAARARSSAALPEAGVRVGRSSDESLRLTPTTSDPYRYTQAGSTTLVLEGRLGWRLDRLVFASEELAVERVRQRRIELRRALVERTLTALIAWYRAERALGITEADAEERLQREVALIEAETTLDVLTGGWFSEHVR